MFCIATVEQSLLGCIGWSVDDAFLNVDPASTSWVVVGSPVVAVIALVVIGGATRVMEAGLACPDWPLLRLVSAGSPDECSGVP